MKCNGVQISPLIHERSCVRYILYTYVVYCPCASQFKGVIYKASHISNCFKNIQEAGCLQPTMTETLLSGTFNSYQNKRLCLFVHAVCQVGHGYTHCWIGVISKDGPFPNRQVSLGS